ncbi:MAG: hypothetical protein P8127_03720, partial [Acidobacteriota bacterium]
DRKAPDAAEAIGKTASGAGGGYGEPDCAPSRTERFHGAIQCDDSLDCERGADRVARRWRSDQ